MKFIIGFLVVFVLVTFSATVYTAINNDITPHNMIDMYHDLINHATRKGAETVEGMAVTVCTTLVRQDIGPLISHTAMIAVTESILELKCADYSNNYSSVDSIDINNEWLGMDWIKSDGHAKLWMWIDVSIPVEVDLSQIVIEPVYHKNGLNVTFVLPAPDFAAPRIDFETINYSLEEASHLSNEERAAAIDSLYFKLVSEAGISIEEEARRSGILGMVEDDLSREIISIVLDIYPEAQVYIEFVEPSSLVENASNLSSNI